MSNTNIPPRRDVQKTLEESRLFTQEELDAINSPGSENVRVICTALAAIKLSKNGTDITPRDPIERASRETILASLALRELAEHPDLHQTQTGVEFGGPNKTVNDLMNAVIHAPGVAGGLTANLAIRRYGKELIANIRSIDDPKIPSLDALLNDNLRVDNAAESSLDPRFAKLGMHRGFANNNARSRNRHQRPGPSASEAVAVNKPDFDPRNLLDYTAKQIHREFGRIRADKDRGFRPMDFTLITSLRMVTQSITRMPLTRLPDNRLIFEGGTPEDRLVINSLLALGNVQNEVGKCRQITPTYYDIITKPSSKDANFPTPDQQLYSDFGLGSLDISDSRGLI